MFTIKNIADKLNLIFHIGDDVYLKNLMFINDIEIYGFRGNRKGVPQFLKRVQDLYPGVDVERLSEDYSINIKLIRANYNIVKCYHTIRHLYPNIEFIYEQSNDPKIEEYSKKFKLLEGIVLPIDDLFWNTYLPPNHSEDNCNIQITDKEVTFIPDNLPPVSNRFIADRHSLFFDKEPFNKKIYIEKSNKNDSLNTMNIDINRLIQEAIDEVYGKK